MKGQQLSDEVEKEILAQDASMKDMWAGAAKVFESICGETLQNGSIKSFEDVQTKIESAVKGTDNEGQDDKWEKVKGVGLKSLKYLRILVGAASQASALIPIPPAAANITSNALCFVFDIPKAIKGYNDAIDQVFSEVSSALSQFRIYESVENVRPELTRQICLVLFSFVKICAHVVKYRQGRRRDRFLQQIKSIFDDDSGLASEMAEFRRLLQQQRDVEGTITLAVVVETQHSIATLLEQAIVFGKATEETHQVVQETQRGVQALKDDADRIKTLSKIRDTLGVPPKVRLDANTTQTCTAISGRALDGTGAWIWAHEAYADWTGPKDKTTSHVLLVSGPPSSGKTTATALITKRLEEQRERTYVAHYFFPASTKKSDDDKARVPSALKYMAFQIARVDATVRKALGKVCELGSAAFRHSASSESLDALWNELKIGVPGSGATYYLVFDGIENLPENQAEMLLAFLFGPKLAGESVGHVRVLASGTDHQFANIQGGGAALRISMEDNNGADMRLIIDDALTKRGMLQRTRPGSDQQRARDKIVEKLPRNVKSSYYLLQFGLDEVIRLLSMRSAAQDLDRMLDQPMSNNEAAIKNLQRSLTAGEISELNELLKWVLFSRDPMTLDELEAIMFLYSGTESLASLEYIIKNKYSTVLKLEDSYVFAQDGVKDYFRRQKEASGKASHSERERSTISMTVTINNVDQELCAHFLWDLAHKAIRDKFKFDFDTTSSNGALHSQGVIAVDEFDAHRTIVALAFQYLSNAPSDQAKAIGWYLVCWLPHHLTCLRDLEDDKRGELSSSDLFEIGENLYRLFKDEEVFRQHRETFEKTYWTAEEMDALQKWLMDSAVVRKLDKSWRDEVRFAQSPTRGFMKKLVKVVVEGFLKERSWEVANATYWIWGFMHADDQRPPQPSSANAGDSDSSVPPSSVGSIGEVDWDRLSVWCQGFLGLQESELDSLWYERLAGASASMPGSKPETVLSLYERAISKESPSWLCYRGLSMAHFGQGRTTEAIAKVELALKDAEQEGTTPKPEAKDVVQLHLLLAQYTYAAGEAEKAAAHYLFACESEDTEQARQGQLGHFKARLASPDAESSRQLLKATLAREDGEGSMASVLKMVARDTEHDALVARIFTLARRDPDLLKGIVRAMETATTRTVPKPTEDRTIDAFADDRFAEDEARGVLLYDRGVAAHAYAVSADGTEPVGEALQLWHASRDLLSNVGGNNAFVARREATTALANHYFQSMVEGKHLNHIEALAQLAKSDSDAFFSDSAGFLGALHALRGEKALARKVLVKYVRQGLQILSDDTPDNDGFGFSSIGKALEQYQDFRKAAMAISLLGQPDIVTDVLSEVGDMKVDDESVDKQRVSDMMSEIAKEIVQVTKSQVPDAAQQLRRIQVAREHADALFGAGTTPPLADQVDPEVDSVTKEGPRKESPDAEAATARRLIHARLSDLHQTAASKLDDKYWSWTCDGRTLDGKSCDNIADFEHEFYHCTYCSNRDFCRECLARLRNPDAEVKITACSARHQWLQIPPQGGDMYVGMRARNVRVPSVVRPMEGDEKILEIVYADGEERSLEGWKEELATEWEVSIEEIKKELSRLVTTGS